MSSPQTNKTFGREKRRAVICAGHLEGCGKHDVDDQFHCNSRWAQLNTEEPESDSSSEMDTSSWRGIPIFAIPKLPSLDEIDSAPRFELTSPVLAYLCRIFRECHSKESEAQRQRQVTLLVKFKALLSARQALMKRSKDPNCTSSDHKKIDKSHQELQKSLVEEYRKIDNGIEIWERVRVEIIALEHSAKIMDGALYRGFQRERGKLMTPLIRKALSGLKRSQLVVSGFIGAMQRQNITSSPPEDIVNVISRFTVLEECFDPHCFVDASD